MTTDNANIISILLQGGKGDTAPFSIDVLNLSTRVRHSLLRKGIETLWDIAENWKEIPSYSNMGEKSLLEIVEKLNDWHEKKAGSSHAEPPGKPLGNEGLVEQSLEGTAVVVELANTPVENLKLPTRIYNMLKRKGVNYIGQIQAVLKIIPPGTQNEIQSAIASLQNASTAQAELGDGALPDTRDQDLTLIQSDSSLEDKVSGGTSYDKPAITKEEVITLPKEFNFDDYFTSLFELIKPRHLSILEFRFGLRDGKKATLEKTAEHFGVTRERVRQIESLALGKLNNQVNQVSQSFFLVKIHEIIEKRGGFISKSRLLYMLEKKFMNTSFSVQGILEVIEKIFGGETTLKQGELKLINIVELSGWSTNNWDAKQILNVADKIINILPTADSPLSWKELFTLLTTEHGLTGLEESLAYSIALGLSDNLKIQHQQDGTWSKNKRAIRHSQIEPNIKQNDSKPDTSTIHRTPEKEKPGNKYIQPIKIAVQPIAPPPDPSSPLSDWENRFAPQLLKVELIGEIPVSKEELETISSHISRLYDSRSEQTVLSIIERYYPATFLVYMVGQGIHGYNGGDFWPAYEQALRHPISHTDFGKLFEKLLQRHGKPQFREMLERSLRYVSLILAHGGIPVYCLKDFFSNIVLNCAIRPQLLALDGDELVEETLKHTSYIVNTDKPVLHFMECGGRTASNLLDRSRKMLLSWQQDQSLLTVDEAGLPEHLVQYFAEWTHENAPLAVVRGARNKLKRPQLSIDPWGLGIFLFLPSQPVSALSINDLNWKIKSGNYHEEIKARTQRKGNQIETREITFRLNDVTENIQVQFSQGENNYDWKISGGSSDNLILAFDPTAGQLQSHIMAREVWLLYPNRFSLSILTGEGSLLEVLPDLPGEWSKFKLESWDLSGTIKLGLIQNDEVFREISVRSREEIALPSLEGGTIISTDMEENHIPVYVGRPPSLHIPLTPVEDIQIELSRWQIHVESIGISDPEISSQTTLADLPATVCSVKNNIASICLEDPQLLNSRPMGTFQIDIKGPLGRDAALSFEILPECDVTGLKELYIPDRDLGPEQVSFSIQTSLLDGVDILNGADGIKVESGESGSHHVLVPAEISSVGLLVRRESIHHQFIGVPIYFQIQRLRWRLVKGHGLVENWMQKHSAFSIQELLQEESPLLIVDLPGDDEGELSLRLDLLDMQGKMIQPLTPTDHSSKRFNRFWRFDLSKIKHSMEIIDSSIFRVDLVGIKDTKGEYEFSLPIFVLTRDIQIKQLGSEVTSSFDQYHVMMTWQEKRQLRSRALILWSLFRPWQLPIIENIPDAACGEYEFSISKKEHAEGIYRMQMVVVDPWDTSPLPFLPPAQGAPGCHDMELSSPHERLREIEREVINENKHQTRTISNRIEISLIRQFLGEIEASYSDLEVCCRNLLAATAPEILILKSILDQAGSKNLEIEFGRQIILPEVLNRLYENVKAGEMALSDFASILKLAPHSEHWPIQTCEILVQLENPKIRFGALTQLVLKDITKAVAWIINLIGQSKLSLEDAVELLYEDKITVIELLGKMDKEPAAEQLSKLLGRYNPYSGLPIAQIGSSVLTNAGWGRIDEILDPSTRMSVDRFMEGDGKYILTVALHIYESSDLTGEKALINMARNEIIFPRANRIFICQHCSVFATTKLEMFKNHMRASHGNALIYPGERTNSIPLTSIEFNMNPQQNKREI